jgi:hypothetical protein
VPNDELPTTSAEVRLIETRADDHDDHLPVRFHRGHWQELAIGKGEGMRLAVGQIYAILTRVPVTTFTYGLTTQSRG